VSFNSACVCPTPPPPVSPPPGPPWDPRHSSNCRVIGGRGFSWARYPCSPCALHGKYAFRLHSAPASSLDSRPPGVARHFHETYVENSVPTSRAETGVPAARGSTQYCCARQNLRSKCPLHASSLQCHVHPSILAAVFLTRSPRATRPDSIARVTL
jgi:hypothetical protein